MTSASASAICPTRRPRIPRSITFAVCLICALGVIARGYELSNRSFLWADELALNSQILDRGWTTLLAPLNQNQRAPIGFLFLQKIGSDFGTGCFGLRVFPFFYGISSIALFSYLLLKNFSDRRIVAFSALAFFCFSDSAIRYSVEAKQYSGDIFWTLLLFCFMQRDPHTTDRWRGALELLSFALAPLFSYVSIFAVGVFAVESTRGWFDGGPLGSLYVRRLTPVASYGVVTVLLFFSFPAFYHSNSQLNSFWAAALTPNSFSAPALIEWLAALLFNYGQWAYGPVGATLGLVSCLVGAIRGRTIRFVRQCTLLICIALMASFLGFYPFSDRLVSFLLAASYTLSGFGISTVPILRQRIMRLISAILGTIVIGVLLYSLIGCFLLKTCQPRPCAANNGENRGQCRACSVWGSL